MFRGMPGVVVDLIIIVSVSDFTDGEGKAISTHTGRCARNHAPHYTLRSLELQRPRFPQTFWSSMPDCLQLPCEICEREIVFFFFFANSSQSDGREGKGK